MSAGGKQQRREEVLGVAVGRALDRRPLLLGFLHQCDDARQRGILTGARDPQMQQSVAVQRAGENLIARAIYRAAEARP